MDAENKCNECLEKLPILFSGRMTSAEREQIAKHLQSCDQCLREFQSLKAIHLAISTNPGDANNIDDLSPELLDTFVFDQESLSTNRVREIESVLAGSTGSREVYQALLEFPTAEQFAAASKRQNKPATERAGIIHIARLAFWNPLAGYAAAAVIAFIFLSPIATLNQQQPVDSNGAHMDMVTLRLPAQTRSSFDSVPTFATSSAPFLAVLTYPEYITPGHSYDVEIVDRSTNSSLFYLRNVTQTDSDGRIQIMVPLDTGTYRLTVYDIEDNDTIPSGNIFEIISE